MSNRVMTRSDAATEPDDEVSLSQRVMLVFMRLFDDRAGNVSADECSTLVAEVAQLTARVEAAEKRAEEEQTKRIDAEVMASLDAVEATECIELKNALGIEWDSGGDEYSTQRWVTVDALDDQTFDNMTKAGEAIISQLTAVLATIERVRALLDGGANYDAVDLEALQRALRPDAGGVM